MNEDAWDWLWALMDMRDEDSKLLKSVKRALAARLIAPTPPTIKAVMKILMQKRKKEGRCSPAEAAAVYHHRLVMRALRRQAKELG